MQYIPQRIILDNSIDSSENIQLYCRNLMVRMLVEELPHSIGIRIFSLCVKPSNGIVIIRGFFEGTSHQNKFGVYVSQEVMFIAFLSTNFQKLSKFRVVGSGISFEKLLEISKKNYFFKFSKSNKVAFKHLSWCKITVQLKIWQNLLLNSQNGNFAFKTVIFAKILAPLAPKTLSFRLIAMNHININAKILVRSSAYVVVTQLLA